MLSTPVWGVEIKKDMTAGLLAPARFKYIAAGDGKTDEQVGSHLDEESRRLPQKAKNKLADHTATPSAICSRATSKSAATWLSANR